MNQVSGTGAGIDRFTDRAFFVFFCCQNGDNFSFFLGV